MGEDNIRQKFRLKKKQKKQEEIDQNELMIKK